MTVLPLPLPLPRWYSVIFSGRKGRDVRYWSLSQYNPDTTLALGMKDDEFQQAADGFVYVAIGGEQIRKQAEKRGYNFMPGKITGDKGVILYRHMLTDPTFPGLISLVPVVAISKEHPENIFLQDAKNFIGDYAPTGEKMSVKEFQKEGSR